MDIELAQLQLADLQATLAKSISGKALRDMEHTKQIAALEARIEQLILDIAEAQAEL